MKACKYIHFNIYTIQGLFFTLKRTTTAASFDAFFIPYIRYDMGNVMMRHNMYLISFWYD